MYLQLTIFTHIHFSEIRPLLFVVHSVAAFDKTAIGLIQLNTMF